MLNGNIIKIYNQGNKNFKETRISRKQEFEFTFLYTIYS